MSFSGQHVEYVQYTLLTVPPAALHGQILQATYSQWISMIKMSFLFHSVPFTRNHPFYFFLISLNRGQQVQDSCGST